MHTEQPDTPKVSLLVAVYNIEKYAAKCIQSLVAQTHKNIEIILVDDGSTDNSGNICDDFAQQDSRITVIHQENARLSAARNTGLDAASGEYVVFVDGDDWLAPDFTSYMLGVITATKADMAISLHNFTSRDATQVRADAVETWTPEKATAVLLYSKISIGAWNKIYRRDFIEKHGLRFKTELFTAEGYRFISDAAQRANRVGVGRRKVYWYRLNNAGSATTKPDIRQGTGSLFALEGIERDLVLRTPPVLAALYRHRWINYFYTLRLILAVGETAENRALLQECIQYLRRNVFAVCREEKSPAPILRYIVSAMVPRLAGRYINHKKHAQLLRDRTE